MDFGLDKCAKCTIRTGKKVEAADIELDDGSRIEYKMMRKKVFNEYVRRLKKICKSQLTIRNKVRAINQLAVPVVSYGFGIVDRPQKDLKCT